MASIDQTQNASFDIEWARGDNDPKLFRIKSGGSVVDISEWVLRMAVNSELNPADGQKQIFSVQGWYGDFQCKWVHFACVRFRVSFA
jgi:hypothetical protein